MKQLIQVGDKVFQMPPFIHEFGDRFHHMSMVRTCVRDEDGAPISGGPSDLSFWFHELLDDIIFYPINHFMQKWVGDNKVYSILRTILGFFWGLNCRFPARDVALYTIWDFRGCPTVTTWRRKERNDMAS